MLHLLRTNGAFTFWFEGLVCLAKAVADEDPDRWHGHLVTPAGAPLTPDDLAGILPSVSRKHKLQVRQFVQVCLERGLLRYESVANPSRILSESAANPPRIPTESSVNPSVNPSESSVNVLFISGFGRWWRAPEKRGKASNGAELKPPPTPQKPAQTQTDFPQAAPLQTDIHTDRQIPPNPQGGPAGGSGGASKMLQTYRTCDPDTFGDPIDEIPEDTSKDGRLASTDQSKLSGHLTVKEQRILRGRADQLLQNLSPGGLARGQQMALHSYLETLPPPGWKDPPSRWSEYLYHFIKRAVSEVEETLAERKDHGIGNPSAVAIGRAKTLAAEKIAEARAKAGKRG